MDIETVKMSSKGQIVIPQDIREKLQAREGSLFAVIENKGSIVLKRIKTPSKEELIKEFKKMAEEGKKRAKKLGIRESDVPFLVHKTRKEKRK